jgi:hypothetical protein
MTDKENVSSLAAVAATSGWPFGGGRQKQALAQVPVSVNALGNGPILLCQSAADPLMIGFGCVQAGKEVQRVVNVFNPSRAAPADVRLGGKHGAVKGLKVHFGSSGKEGAHRRIPPMGSEALCIKWTPGAATSLTEMIELKLNSSITLIVTVTGVAALAEVINS